VIRRLQRAVQVIVPTRRLRPLIGSRLLGTTAEWLWYPTATVIAFQTGGVDAVAVVAIAAVGPAALTSPAISYFIDRLPPRQVLIAAMAMRMLAVGGAAISYALDPNLPVIVVAAAVEGVAALITRPVGTALLPALATRPADLLAGFAALGSVENAGLLLGAAGGAGLLAVVDPGVALTVAAGVAAASVVAAARVRAPTPPPRRRDESAIKQLGTGFTAMWAPGIRITAVAAAVGMALTGVSEVTLVVLAFDVLGMSDAGPPFLTACIGAGGVAASLAVGGSQRGFTRLLVGGGAATAVAFLVAGSVTVRPVVFAAVVLLGAGFALIATCTLALLQRLAADDMIGRVTGLAEALGFAALCAGAALAPISVNAWGPRTTLIVAALAVALIGVIVAPGIVSGDRRGLERVQELAAVDDVGLFEPLPILARARLAAHVQRLAVDARDFIVIQGERDDRLFVLDTGEADVLVDGEIVSRVGPGDYFGEVALLGSGIRTASIRAITDSTLRAIDRSGFLSALAGEDALRELFHDNPAYMRPRGSQVSTEHWAGIARQLLLAPLFVYVHPERLRTLARDAVIVTLEEGQPLYNTGEPAEHVWVVRTGRLQVTSNDGSRTAEAGETVGERDALRTLAHTDSALALEHSELVGVDARAAFTVLADASAAAR
jgi:CRP-like cAMP-binding protein/MFS family permease